MTASVGIGQLRQLDASHHLHSFTDSRQMAEAGGTRVISRGEGVHVYTEDGKRYLFFREVVAGIIEHDDRGEEGIRRRAALEVEEEAGYRVPAESVRLLGAGTFPSPGAMAERFWLAAVEVADPAAAAAPAGDGSPMEEGATTVWMDLDAAIAACVRGEIEDLKTEVALRRLRDAPG